jgi:hypothetical protein
MRDHGGLQMSEKIKSEMISRRRIFRLLGLTAGWGFAAAAPSLLASSGAKAQTEGMKRRQERRTGRQENRQDRRTNRQGGTGSKSGDTDD